MIIHSSLWPLDSGRRSILSSSTISIVVNDNRVKCTLENELYVLNLGYQLLSVPTMDKAGYKTEFSTQTCSILHEDKVLATGSLVNNLYRLDTVKASSETALAATDLSIWHQRLGHVHHSATTRISSNNIMDGLNIKESTSKQANCEGCILGKSKCNAIHQESNSKTSSLLELVHSDVCGPFETPSLFDPVILLALLMTTQTGLLFIQSKENLKFSNPFRSFTNIQNVIQDARFSRSTLLIEQQNLLRKSMPFVRTMAANISRRNYKSILMNMEFIINLLLPILRSKTELLNA